MKCLVFNIWHQLLIIERAHYCYSITTIRWEHTLSWRNMLNWCCLLSVCLCWGLLWHVQSCLSDKRIEGHSWFWQSLISLASDSHVDCSISTTAGHDFLRMGMFLYCLSSIYLSVCLSVCLSIGTSQKIIKSWKRSIFVVTHFRKWNPYII